MALCSGEKGVGGRASTSSTDGCRAGRLQDRSDCLMMMAARVYGPRMCCCACRVSHLGDKGAIHLSLRPAPPTSCQGLRACVPPLSV